MADTEQLFAQAEAAWRGGDGAAAQALSEQVLAADPGHVGALMILTNLRFAVNDIAGARPYLQTLADLMPDEVMVRNNLGRSMLADEAPDQAAQEFQAVLARDPQNARALDGLGIARHRLGDYEGAADLHRRATASDPGFAAAWCNLGIACTDLGLYAAGAAALDKALSLDPQDPRTRFNRSILYLLDGDYAAGWPMYEARLAFQSIQPPPGARLWAGEPLSGERVLLVPEQGFGDFIQFARFIPLVIARGGRPVLATPAPLRDLFAAQGWDAEIADGDASAPLWCPMMSLGAALSIGPDDLTGAAYLKAPTVAAGDGFRVGLAWAGNPTHRRDRERSLRLADLAPVLAVSGVRFVNLQVGLRPDDAAMLAERPQVFAESPSLASYADTAAVVAGLDLVISADTSVLHLAGAMGCPAWGLLPKVPDWRWGPDGDRTAWNDSLRLYRQERRGDWAGVTARVVDDLSKLAAD
mgnify:FL=1